MAYRFDNGFTEWHKNFFCGIPCTKILGLTLGKATTWERNAHEGEGDANLRRDGERSEGVGYMAARLRWVVARPREGE